MGPLGSLHHLLHLLDLLPSDKLSFILARRALSANFPVYFLLHPSTFTRPWFHFMLWYEGSPLPSVLWPRWDFISQTLFKKVFKKKNKKKFFKKIKSQETEIGMITVVFGYRHFLKVLAAGWKMVQWIKYLLYNHEFSRWRTCFTIMSPWAQVFSAHKAEYISMLLYSRRWGETRGPVGLPDLPV